MKVQQSAPLVPEPQALGIESTACSLQSTRFPKLLIPRFFERCEYEATESRLGEDGPYSSLLRVLNMEKQRLRGDPVGAFLSLKGA